jgi:hypothetical protein
MTHDQPAQDACKLGPTGRLLRRALPPVHAPADFRADLLRRLVNDPAHRASGQRRATPRPRSSR